MPEIALTTVARLVDDAPTRIALPGLPPLVVVRRGACFHVFDDRCTHDEASLGDGSVEGEELFCPRHRGAFALADGRATRPPCFVPLRRHAARVVDGVLYVEWAG
ncbi:MAG: Rieske (2Fe-2S) protein [Gammaproteobacteria bacterium]